jgi:hypothetical protein
MKSSKFTETQIVSILKQAEAGIPVKDICRQADPERLRGEFQWEVQERMPGRTFISEHRRSKGGDRKLEELLQHR